MRGTLLAALVVATACAQPPDPGQEPVCIAAAPAEQACSDGVDDDCDGFTDCLDNECDGQTCGTGDGYTCVAGACVRPGALPPLPRIDNLKVTVRGDTALVDFSPVDNARDYRVYVLPADADVLVGANGEVAVKNAIYRCAGERPRADREHDGINQFDRSLAGGVQGYTRTEAESVLGYVYLTPGADRVPVYRVADPNLRGGYTWEYGAPPAKEYNGAHYVVGTDARDALIAEGMRDDGIAFYAPVAGDRPVYRRQYRDGGISVFYTDGPEQVARAGDDAASVDFGERFRILATQAPGSVALHRVLYGWANDHDILAAGDARLAEVLHQGNTPVTTVTWPGLTAETTLVIEALDGGCPFPGSYIGPIAAPAGTLDGITSRTTITLDQARLSSGEVFINGQADPTSRPRPIARAYVTVAPQPHPTMDWFQSFDPQATWEPLTKVVDDNIGTVVLRNSALSVELPGTTNGAYTYGPLLGQFVVGSTASIRLAARGVDASLANDSFLHVTMAADIPSTFRRYPQIFITTVPEIAPDAALSYQVPIEARLGPFPFEGKTGTEDTIVVQPFSTGHEMQVQVCHHRGWGVSQQCDRANLYGYHAGLDQPQPWVAGVAWTPMPVLGELAGVDRPVKFDVYASTRRVYVFVEDQPAGCADIPAGQLAPGPRTVMFGSAGYHIEIDEGVVPDFAPHAYWQRYHRAHVQRAFDDLGIERGVAAPAWDEARMPCGTHWYGGSQ